MSKDPKVGATAPRAGVSNEELREAQFTAALRYIQGVRDHYLSVDWKSVLYYAGLFKKGETK